MKNSVFLVLIAFFMTLNCAFAQFRNSPSSSLQTSIPTFSNVGLSLQSMGILDPSKLSMSHSFSSSYSSYGRGNSLSALYLNSMQYSVSPKFHWLFQLGYAGQPYSTFQNDLTGGAPVGSFGFVWRPKSNLYISAQMSKGLMYSPLDNFSYRPWYYKIDE